MDNIGLWMILFGPQSNTKVPLWLGLLFILLVAGIGWWTGR